MVPVELAVLRLSTFWEKELAKFHPEERDTHAVRVRPVPLSHHLVLFFARLLLRLRLQEPVGCAGEALGVLKSSPPDSESFGLVGQGESRQTGFRGRM